MVAAAATLLLLGLTGCDREDTELPEAVVAWEPVDDPALAGDDAEEILDVTVLDGRLVAVGATAPRARGAPPARIGRPAVWVSDDDGASWRRVADDRIAPTPPELAQHERAAMTSVVALERAGGPRLVAAGPATHIKDLLVWISDDRGESWQLAPDQRALVGESLGSLSAGRNVVAALGTRLGRIGPDFDRHFEVEVRVSPDGRRWQRAQRTLPDPGGGGVDLDGVAAHEGRFVAIGASSEEPGQPLVWVSDGGLRWELVGPEAHGFRGGAGLDTISSGPAGFLAAGSGRGTATIWASEDGIHWVEVGALPANRVRFLSLAAHDDGRVAAVATMATGPESADHLVLVGGDDDQWRWTRTAEEPRRIAAVVATADGFVAVGAVATDDASDAAAWIYTAPPDP